MMLVALAIWGWFFFFLTNLYGFFLSSANMRTGSGGTVMNWFLWKLVKNVYLLG